MPKSQFNPFIKHMFKIHTPLEAKKTQDHKSGPDYTKHLKNNSIDTQNVWENR